MAKKGQTFRKYRKDEKMKIIETATKTIQTIVAKDVVSNRGESPNG